MVIAGSRVEVSRFGAKVFLIESSKRDDVSSNGAAVSSNGAAVSNVLRAGARVDFVVSWSCALVFKIGAEGSKVGAKVFKTGAEVKRVGAESLRSDPALLGISCLVLSLVGSKTTFLESETTF